MYELVHFVLFCERRESMTEEHVKEVMSVVKDRIPEEKYAMLKNRLKSADDRKADEILSVKLHGTVNIILLSIFLGGLGIDRFVIGDIGMGVGKLLIGWLTLGIWPLIDIFLCYKKAREKNFIKLMNFLA